MRIEKYNPKTVWTAVLDDARQGFPYIKRFSFEDSARRQRYVGDDARSSLILLTDQAAPKLVLHFADENRVDQELDVADYIGVKSFSARGKRLTTFELASVELLPAPEPEVPEEAAEADELGSTVADIDTADEAAAETPHAETPSLFDDEEDM